MFDRLPPHSHEELGDPLTVSDVKLASKLCCLSGEP